MPSLSDELVDAVMAFLVPLRMADGYSEENFQRMCESVRKFNRSYADSDSIPKVVASVFVELNPAIEGCMSLYNESERKQLLDAAVTVTEIILEGL